MAQYRDIDLPTGVVLRVNGDLTIPSNNLVVGGIISGNGSLITNLSSANMAGVLLLDGTRTMTGNLNLGNTNKLVFHYFDASNVDHIHHDDTTNTFHFVSDGALGVAGNSKLKSGSMDTGAITATTISATTLTLTGSITATGQTVTAGTVNATANLQENGTNLSSKYALQTTQVIAGTGLTGGGDLTTNRTLSVIYSGDGVANSASRSDHSHANYARGVLQSYTSVSGDDGTDGWYTLFTVNDNATAPIQCNIKCYAHTSASFIVSKGYSTNYGIITVLHSNTSSTNGAYKYIKGIRILSDGAVQIKLNGGASVNIQAQLIGNGVNSSLVSTLTKEIGTPTVLFVIDPLINGSIVTSGDFYSGTNKAWHAGNFDPDTKTDKTTTITAGTGLSGGGDFTANRTLSVVYAGNGAANSASRSDHDHNTTYLGISATAADSDKLDGLSSTDFAREYKASVPNISNAQWTTIAYVDGSGLNSKIRLSIGGTGSNIVVAMVADIVVNHSNDIYIQSHSGNYTEVTLRIVSDTNDNFYIQVKTNSANVGTFDCRIFSYGGETVTMYTNNPAPSGTLTFDHVCPIGKLAISSTGGSSPNIVIAGNEAWHAGNFTPSNYSLATHNHDSAYLGITAKAADSELLDGLDSTGYLKLGTASTITAEQTFNAGIKMNPYGVGAKLASIFGTNTYKSYINLNAVSGSNDPGFIMHETSSEAGHENKGVIHICPTDDNDNVNDYVTIHGTNDPETIKMYTGGKITTVSTINADSGFTVGANSVWHAGNLTPSQYVKNDTASQSVTGDFSLVGNATLYVGTTATNSGSIVLKGAGANVIQLDGANSGKLSGVKAYLNGSTGHADFTGTVTANKIAVTDTAEVPNLNAQKVGGKTEKELAKNESILELGGYGVHTGTSVSAQTVPNMTVKIDAGTVYTDSGRRVTFDGLGSQSITGASATYGRLDVIYVQGSSSGVNEGSIGYMAGTPSATPVEPAWNPSGDRVKLAVISVPQNIGSIQANQITDARVWKSVIYNSDKSVFIKEVKTDSIKTDMDNKITFNAPIKGTSFAKTITISAGQTSATWTHNLSLGTTYTIVLSSDSPNRHIYWTNKATNSIIVNIDDITDVAINIDAVIVAY